MPLPQQFHHVFDSWRMLHTFLRDYLDYLLLSDCLDSPKREISRRTANHDLEISKHDPPVAIDIEQWRVL